MKTQETETHCNKLKKTKIKTSACKLKGGVAA